jgi:hypothetical protein
VLYACSLTIFVRLNLSLLLLLMDAQSGSAHTVYCPRHLWEEFTSLGLSVHTAFKTKRSYSGRKITESLGNVTVRGAESWKEQGGRAMANSLSEHV